MDVERFYFRALTQAYDDRVHAAHYILRHLEREATPNIERVLGIATNLGGDSPTFMARFEQFLRGYNSTSKNPIRQVRSFSRYDALEE